MRRLLALTMCASALALAACGSSTKVLTESQTSSSTPTSTSTSSATAASSSSSSTSTTSSTTIATAGAGSRCVAAGLTLSFLGQQGGAGHGELGFALRNSGSSSCHTFGYPGVLFLSASGAALPTRSTRTTSDLFGPAPETALTLAPGETASFRLVVTHGLGSSSGCTTAHGLQVIPPDDTHTLRVTIPDGAYECGTATVSPLQPGSSAYR